MAKSALTKQLDDAEDELEQMETAARQKVIRSAEYIELRERYKMSVEEARWLKEEIDHLEKQAQSGSANSESLTLTVSLDSVMLD